MGCAPAVAAPKARHRNPPEYPGNSAFALPVSSHCTDSCGKGELRMNQEIIDMPPGGGSTFARHPDVSCHPGEPGSPLGRTDIYVPSLRKVKDPKSTHPCAALPVAENQAVGPANHILPAEPAVRLQCVACRCGGPEIHDRDRDLQHRAMQAGRWSGTAQPGCHQGNHTFRTLHR